MRSKAVILAAVFTLLGPLALAGGGKWLNVHVTERTDDTEVNIHVPMSLVSIALDAVETGRVHHGRLRVCMHDHDLDWQEIVRELKAVPPGQEFTRREDEADIRLRRIGEQVEILVMPREPGQERVELHISAPLFDLLAREHSEALDFKELSRELAEATGELLTLASDDADVRIWVE